MRKILVVLVSALTLAVLVPASPASAAPPETLEIVAIESFTDGAVDPGTFTATSDAFCDAGTVATTTDGGTPIGTTGLVAIDADKVFTCTDGSGSISVHLKIVLDDSTGDTTAKWKITGGTDDYAGAKGHGDLLGVPIVQGVSITDNYTGTIK